MYLPALLLLLIFIFYPFVQGVRLSFTDWNGYSEHFHWVGLIQYQRFLADPDMMRTIINTFIYGIGSTLLQNILGLAYALFLDRKMRGKGIMRTIVYLPIIISPLIMSYICYLFGGSLSQASYLRSRWRLKNSRMRRRASWAEGS